MSDSTENTSPEPVHQIYNSPAPSAPTVIVQTGRGFVSRLFCWLGWAGCICCLAIVLLQSMALSDYFDTTEGIEEKYHSLSKDGDAKVAVISIKGAILSGEGYVKKQIDRVRADEKVKAVVIRVDSPGGTITGSDYIYHHLVRLREEKKIPMVVSMGSMAASGGYYVAMAVGDQEKAVYAEPTTTTGSIGVIIPHYDISGLLARFDVKDDSIVSHPRKQMLSMTRPISDDDREVLQAYLDEAFVRFKDIVKQGRPVFAQDPAALDRLATGQIYTAQQARRSGLVDEIGFIEDAIHRAMELAGLNEKRTRAVYYKRPSGLLELPFMVQGESQGLSLNTMFELNSPKAYYLATTLPPLLVAREE